jgi:hypothetical protein
LNFENTYVLTHFWSILVYWLNDLGLPKQISIGNEDCISNFLTLTEQKEEDSKIIATAFSSHEELETRVIIYI